MKPFPLLRFLSWPFILFITAFYGCSITRSSGAAGSSDAGTVDIGTADAGADDAGAGRMDAGPGSAGPDDAGGPGGCNPQDALDFLNLCGEIIIWQPGEPCEPSDGGGLNVYAPSGYLTSADFAQTFNARCEQNQAGALLSCLALSCRELVQLYAGNGGSSSSVQTFVNPMNDWCGPLATSPQRPLGCEEACNNADPELQGSVPCAGSTWGACEACEQSDYDAWTSCYSACGVSSCGDGIRDDGESDVDCGGGACQTCLEGRSCAVNADCRSKHCDLGVCQAATCSDGIQNAFETDVDCGAFCHSPCASGKACAWNVDCSSDQCNHLAGNQMRGTCK